MQGVGAAAVTPLSLTIATSGWDEPKLRAERFQRIGSSNVPALWGLRAAIELAETIGLESPRTGL